MAGKDLFYDTNLPYSDQFFLRYWKKCPPSPPQAGYRGNLCFSHQKYVDEWWFFFGVLNGKIYRIRCCPPGNFSGCAASENLIKITKIIHSYLDIYTTLPIFLPKSLRIWDVRTTRRNFTYSVVKSAHVYYTFKSNFT